jgi:DNA-binding LytR/AlgR family response regulator
MKEYLIINTNSELVRIASDDVLCIIASGNYSTITAVNGETRLVTLQLGQVERLIANQVTAGNTNFIRIGKSLIINRQYVSYINIQKQQLSLTDGKTPSHTLTASREALKQLKEVITG